MRASKSDGNAMRHKEEARSNVYRRKCSIASFITPALATAGDSSAYLASLRHTNLVLSLDDLSQCVAILPSFGSPIHHLVVKAVLHGSRVCEQYQDMIDLLYNIPTLITVSIPVINL